MPIGFWGDPANERIKLIKPTGTSLGKNVLVPIIDPTSKSKQMLAAGINLNGAERTQSTVPCPKLEQADPH